MTTTTAANGETVFLGDLVVFENGAIQRRALAADLPGDPLNSREPPAPNIYIWNGVEALPFQEAMGQTFDIG